MEKDLGPILLVSRAEVMISWGHSFFIVRGEILGFMKDERLRKHLPRMFSLTKNAIIIARLSRLCPDLQ